MPPAVPRVPERPAGAARLPARPVHPVSLRRLRAVTAVLARLRDPRTRRVALVCAGIGGWAFAGWLWIVGTMWGQFRISGDVSQIFLPAGQAFWAGGSPYDLAITPEGRPFLYAPPWAALFGILAPAGPVVVHALLTILELLALRYIAGSWLRAGAFCWFLLVPWEIAAGQLNLLCAAAIVAAVRGRSRPAAIMGLAKISPVLGVHPRDWRPVLATVAVFALLSLPHLGLWIDWFGRLAWASGRALGPLVPVPFLVRLPVGLALVAYGRPWSRALGAVVATPGLYWSALVLFVAPLGIVVNPSSNAPAAPWAVPAIRHLRDRIASAGAALRPGATGAGAPRRPDLTTAAARVSLADQSRRQRLDVPSEAETALPDRTSAA